MIDIEDVDGVTVVHMRAGENRFDGTFTAALGDALERLDGPLVLTGEGRSFSNGLDLDWLGAADPAAAAATFRRLHRVLARLLAFPGATAAAVNGHAFGAGAILAAACDHRVMRADRGYFCFPEVDLGLAMSAEFDAVLQARYPRQALLDALLSGQRFGGVEAVAAGLVDEAVLDADVVPAAVAAALALAGKDGPTIGALKARLYSRELEILCAS